MQRFESMHASVMLYWMMIHVISITIVSWMRPEAEVRTTSCSSHFAGRNLAYPMTINLTMSQTGMSSIIFSCMICTMCRSICGVPKPAAGQPGNSSKLACITACLVRQHAAIDAISHSSVTADHPANSSSPRHDSCSGALPTTQPK